MKQFAEKLIKRNYAKRILAIAIAAVLLLVAVAVLVPTVLHRQIAEFRTQWKALEAQEEQDEQQKAAESTSAETNLLPADGKNAEKAERRDKEHQIKAILRGLPPVSTGGKIAFAAVALLALLLGIFYWITVVEWYYKTAVLRNLNRAL